MLYDNILANAEVLRIRELQSHRERQPKAPRPPQPQYLQGTTQAREQRKSKSKSEKRKKQRANQKEQIRKAARANLAGAGDPSEGESEVDECAPLEEIDFLYDVDCNGVPILE